MGTSSGPTAATTTTTIAAGAAAERPANYARPGHHQQPVRGDVRRLQLTTFSAVGTASSAKQEQKKYSPVRQFFLTYLKNTENKREIIFTAPTFSTHNEPS